MGTFTAVRRNITPIEHLYYNPWHLPLTINHNHAWMQLKSSFQNKLGLSKTLKKHLKTFKKCDCLLYVYASSELHVNTFETCWERGYKRRRGLWNLQKAPVWNIPQVNGFILTGACMTDGIISGYRGAASESSAVHKQRWESLCERHDSTQDTLLT